MPVHVCRLQRAKAEGGEGSRRRGAGAEQDEKEGEEDEEEEEDREEGEEKDGGGGAPGAGAVGRFVSAAAEKERTGKRYRGRRQGAGEEARWDRPLEFARRQREQGEGDVYRDVFGLHYCALFCRATVSAVCRCEREWGVHCDL